MNYLFLTAALGVFAAGQAERKTGEPITVPLVSREITDTREAFSLARAGFGGRSLAVLMPPQLPKDLVAPPWKQRTNYFYLNGSQGHKTLAAFAGTIDGGPSAIWVDYNGDRRYSDEEVIKGTRSPYG